VTGHKCLAWCLMDNHYHLVLRSNENPLSGLMRPLNGAYARWFNKRHHRRGYLFQDRYKSILCQDLEYALQLIRYVHLNPLRAGKVASLTSLCDWKWSGHALLLGKPGALGREFQDCGEVLRRFGRDSTSARREYLAYLAEGIDPAHVSLAGELPHVESTESEGSHRGWPAVIGDPEYAKRAMAAHEIGSRRRHRKADYGAVLRKAAQETCREFGIGADELLVRGRRSARSAARARFCSRVHREELLPMSVIARHLNITIPSVAALVRRGGTRETANRESRAVKR